jgi:hypothetical protein
MGQRLAALLFGGTQGQATEGPSEATVAILPPPRKRQRARSRRQSEIVVTHSEDVLGASVVPPAAAFLGLQLDLGIVHAVTSGPVVEETFGAHYHLYPASDIEATHGIALGWDLKLDDLSASALLRLARISNSCKKTLVVTTGDEGGTTSWEVSYTSTL